ncbi:MAG: 2OG-Fe(II) oxygenase [Bacteroidota bacterium]
MSIYLNTIHKDLVTLAQKYAPKYKTNTPFPNIYFKNFFDPNYLEEVLEEFPDLSQKKSERYNDQFQLKLAGKGERFFGEQTKSLMHFLNSQPFLEFLQILTGIERPIISDPYFLGGGQHEIKKGGMLKIHADFNKHHQLDLDRRLNVLVYLNKDWEEGYGGYFELWNKEMTHCVKKIPPTFNTVAIFSTTDFSYHGHPDPLNCPPDRSRKSLALYYYTNGRPDQEVIKNQKRHSTLFVSRAGDETDVFKQTNNYGVIDLIRDLTPPVLVKLGKKVLNK